MGLKRDKKRLIRSLSEQRDVIIKKRDNTVLNGTSGHPTVLLCKNYMCYIINTLNYIIYT
jgi:hypothetical protein